MGLTPEQIIRLVNQHEGRETGPPATGYVDENGLPVEPPWGQGAQHVEVANPTFALPSVPREAVDNPTEPPPAPDPTMAAATNEPLNLFDLRTGDGWYNNISFKLSEREFVAVKRVIVGAITRDIRAQQRALTESVGGLKRRPTGPRMRKPRKTKVAPPPTE